MHEVRNRHFYLVPVQYLNRPAYQLGMETKTKDSRGMAESQKRFLLLYGSQTGQAQAIAEEIYKSGTERGYAPEMHCMSAADKEVRELYQETTQRFSQSGSFR